MAPSSADDYPYESAATEADPRLHALNKASQEFQFNLAALEAMGNDQLIYLAAHDPAVDTFADDEEGRTKKNKLESNARRACLILERRWAEASQIRASAAVTRSAWIAALAAILGAIVGALIVKFA